MVKKSAIQSQQQQQQLQQQQHHLAMLPPPDAAANITAAGPHLKIEDFVWMRDKFANGLQTLETGVRELRLAYLNHFNTYLPEGHPSRLEPPFFPLGATNFSDAEPPSVLQASAPSAVPTAGAPGSNTKRKRKPHDPNAPKRALTSYFLFMQNTKPKIKEEHPDWAANQISEESERRWANIDKAEKQRYEYMYNVDLARYYKQKEEYDAGRSIPEIDSDEALRLYQEHLKTGSLIKGRKGRRVLETAAASGQPVSAATNPGAESSEEDDHDGQAKSLAIPVINENEEAEGEDEESEEEHAPPPKAKKPKTNRGTPAKPTETPKRKIESVQKGRGKKGKAAAEAEASENSPVEEATPAAAKKEKKGGRKRKSTGEK